MDRAEGLGLTPGHPARIREDLVALDEIFAQRERDSDLAIAEPTTDTAGFTDLLFGPCDLVGLGFSPRIRDLAEQRSLSPTSVGSPL